MKKHLLGLLACALFAAHAPAQLFTSNTGGPAQAIFTTESGQTVGGLATASNGDLIFELRDSNATTLVRLAHSNSSPTGFEATPQTLFNYSSAVFPGFVKVFADQVFFSDTTSYNIRKLDLATFAAPLDETALTPFATLEGAQDLTVRPADVDGSGKAAITFVSARSFSSSSNEVFRLTLAGVAVSVLDTGGDFSGPVAALSDNSLLYGRSGSDFGSKMPGDIFAYSQSEIDGSPSGGVPISLNDSHKIIADYSNSLFHVAGLSLFATEPHGFGLDRLLAYDLGHPSADPLLLGSATNASYDLSGLAASQETVFVAVTDFTSFPPAQSVIYQIAVPEPSTVLLTLLGVMGLLSPRSRRR